MIICVVDGCAGVQPMRMKRVGGNSPYEEQGEEYVGKGESVEFALKICETGCDCEERVWCVLLFVVADIEVNDVCYESVQDNRDGLWRWFKSIGGTMNGIDELQSVVECAICIGDIRKWEWNVLWNLWKNESECWCWAGCVKGKEFERVTQQGSERYCFCVWWFVMVGFVVLKR